KLSAQSAINHTMVVGEGEVHHVPDPDHVALIGFDDGRLLRDGTNSQYRNLWLIDDGRAHDIAERADVGEGKCAVLSIIGSQFVVAGAVGQVVNRFAKPDQAKLVGIFDNRYN